MAAAYAAVMSLMNTINLILRMNWYDFLDSDEDLRSLQEKATTLLTFLEESCQSTDEEVKRMEVLIRYAAHEAHDVIDSYVSRVIVQSERIQDMMELQKVTKEISSLSEKVKNMPGDSRDPPSKTFLSGSSSSTSVEPPSDRNKRSSMIGFEKDLVEIKSQLVGNRSGIQIILIVGMGGAGKTTLARNVYEDSLIVHHFHVRGWATVSQEYNIRDIILSLLGNNEKLQGRDIEDLGVDLHKRLKGRTYLLILDDVWDKKFYDCVRRFFPNDDNGSRIILTTRQLDVAEYVDSLASSHHMSFLDEGVSWNLLKNKVFGEGDCPPELEYIGRVIARDCKGLPLAIVVIGGALAKVQKTVEHWWAFGENLKSIVAHNEEECIEVLYLSYRYLPPHLKPCLLYMGAFPEDHVVGVTRLVHLWMAEGFLKPDLSKSLSEVAHDYVEDLIDRNLILAHERDITGKARFCKIHDVIRELCLREANKESFLYVFDKQVLQGTEKEQHRVAICNRYDTNMYHILPYATHSLICSTTDLQKTPKFLSGSLKVMDMLANRFEFSTELNLVNLRYIAFRIINGRMPSSLSQFWNLQTLILRECDREIPSDLWDMTELRLIDVDGYISAPPIPETSGTLENLEIMCGINDIKWTEEAIMLLANLKELRMTYGRRENPWGEYQLYNLCFLPKLKDLHCSFEDACGLRHSMVHWLPESLMELTLERGRFPWSAMTNVGSLPNLQVLRISQNAFCGTEWEPNEGEFLQLKFLQLRWVSMENWRAESNHFPLLRHLVLSYCFYLIEIPSGIGEIPTLEKIEVLNCTKRIEESAKQIQDEQREEYGNDSLQLIVENNTY